MGSASRTSSTKSRSSAGSAAGDGQSGVDLDRLAELNRRLAVALDENDPIPGSYSLEVGSPGLERKLRTADHWRGAVGAEKSIGSETCS